MAVAVVLSTSSCEHAANDIDRLLSNAFADCMYGSKSLDHRDRALERSKEDEFNMLLEDGTCNTCL